MQSLWLLTKKNIRLLLRAKSSALIIVLAPLLLILILGLAYNTSEPAGLVLGVHAPSFTGDVSSFITLLEDNQFTVLRYEQSISPCIEDIKSGAVHTCIALPESLTVESNTAKEITFYLDPSRINLVWMVQETVKSAFNFKAQELSTQLAGNILSALAQAKSSVSAAGTTTASIAEKSTSASGSVDAAQASLGSASLEPLQTSYDASILENATTSLASAADALTTAVQAVDASATLDEGEKESLHDLLDHAQNQLDRAKGFVDGGIPALVNNLLLDVSLMQERLRTAVSAIDSSHADLEGASAILQETLSSLAALQSALSSIHSSLDAQQVTDPNTIAIPLVTRIEKVGKESTYLNYTFPTLLVLVIMFTSLLLGTILVMMEKNSPAFMRNFFLPVKKVIFIASTYLTTMLLMAVQIIIILGISLFFLPETAAALPLIVLILFIAASFFIFLGMTVGYLFVSEETGVLASISLGSLFLFLSGVVLPIEALSPTVREALSFNPFVLAEGLIREVFIFRSPLTLIWADLLILLGYAFLFFLVVLFIESVLHQMLTHKFMRHHHKVHRQHEKQQKGYSWR